MDGLEEDPKEIVHFSLGPTSPGGGITKVKLEDFLRTQGKGGSIIHLIVDDLDEAMKVRPRPRWTDFDLADVVVQKVIAAGGRKVSEVQPEGTRAFMQSYEDTEGNFGGLYMMKRE